MRACTTDAGAVRRAIFAHIVPPPSSPPISARPPHAAAAAGKWRARAPSTRARADATETYSLAVRPPLHRRQMTCPITPSARARHRPHLEPHVKPAASRAQRAPRRHSATRSSRQLRRRPRPAYSGVAASERLKAWLRRCSPCTTPSGDASRPGEAKERRPAGAKRSAAISTRSCRPIRTASLCSTCSLYSLLAARRPVLRLTSASSPSPPRGLRLVCAYPNARCGSQYQHSKYMMHLEALRPCAVPCALSQGAEPHRPVAVIRHRHRRPAFRPLTGRRSRRRGSRRHSARR